MNAGSSAAILIAAIAILACRTVKVPIATTSAQADTSIAARRLIEEALAAKGGNARLASLRTLRLTAAGTTTIKGESGPVEITRVFAFPDNMRVDATGILPGVGRYTVSAAITGETSWQRTVDPETNKDVSSEVAGSQLQTIRFERWRNPDLILLRATDPGAVLAVVPDGTVVGGVAYSVVKLRAPFGEVVVFLYVNKKTKLIGRIVYSDGSQTESDDFDDYRDVGGLQFAYKCTSNGGGRSTVLELKAVEVNPEIDLTLFDKPAPK